MSSPVTSEIFDSLEEFFSSRGAPVFHEVSPLAGVEVFAQLADRGYRPIELTSVLYRRVSEPVVDSLNHGSDIKRVEVRRVRPDEYGTWAEVSARGWAPGHPELAEFLSDFGSVMAQKSDAVSFLAEIDGTPIAAGSLSISNGTALLAGASTVPEARRQGAQQALFSARLRHAADNGCSLVMMCAAPGSSSQHNAERQGFRIAYTRVKWALHRHVSVSSFAAQAANKNSR
jgi:GNAT superfamily N-acetyltransferase